MFKKMLVVTLVLSIFLFAHSFIISAQTPKYTIKLGHIDPVSHPHNKASERFKEIVEEKTGGEIKVEVYPAGQLGNAPNLMEQLRLGSVEMFQGGIGWWGSYIPDYWLVASNFVFDSLDHSRTVMKGEIGQNLAQELKEYVGVTALTQGMIRNPRNLLTKEPVRTLDDLKGLKIRVPEMQNWLVPWKALGANPTPMPLSETYLGLQQGVVDGVEHGFPQLYLNNYTEVAKYCTITQHQFEMAGFFISNVFYDKLSDEYKQIIQEAAAEAEEYNNKLQVEYKEDTRQKMKEEDNVKFIEIDRKPWYEVGRKIMQEEVVPKLDITPGLLEKIWDTPAKEEMTPY